MSLRHTQKCGFLWSLNSGPTQWLFLPSEGANNIALALFTFESLAAYEEYRIKSLNDAECIKAFEFADEVDCIVSYERSFFRPVLE